MGLFDGSRRKAKLEYKTRKQELKYGAKEAKYQTQAVAYANGIDPKASMWQGLSSIANSASRAVGGVFGKGTDPMGAAFSPTGSSSSFSLIGVVIVVVILLFGKKMFR